MSQYYNYKELRVLAYSDAQREATARYNKKSYDRIEIKVKKGEKAKIAGFAKSHNLSVNQFITRAVYREMERDSD